jgi:hypothetical protein
LEIPSKMPPLRLGDGGDPDLHRPAVALKVHLL